MDKPGKTNSSYANRSNSEGVTTNNFFAKCNSSKIVNWRTEEESKPSVSLRVAEVLSAGTEVFTTHSIRIMPPNSQCLTIRSQIVSLAASDED